MITYLKNNFWLIIVFSAILVGVLYAAPQFLMLQDSIGNDRPFILQQFSTINDEGYFYLQNAREVYDGHFPPKDFFFDADEQRVSIFNPIPPTIFSGFISVTKDINTAYILANLILPIILFLLFYALGQVIFLKDKLWSLVLSFVALLTPIALIVPRAFFGIDNFSNIVLKNFYPGVKTLLPRIFYSRIDYPLITDLVYLPTIIFFILFWKNPKRTTAVLTGIFSGLLFYTYFHYWVYWLVVLVGLFFYTILFLREDTQRIKNYIILLGITFLISIPYFFNYFKFAGGALGEEFTKRLGLEVGRMIKPDFLPHIISYVIIATLIYLVFWRGLSKDLRKKGKAVLFWGFLAAGIVVWNVQLVLGFVPHSDHWPRVISPLIFIIIFSLLFVLVKKITLFNPRIKKVVTSLLILLLLLLGAKKVVNAVLFINPPQELQQDFTMPKDLVASWQWIEVNITGEPKIISPSFMSTIYLTAFTAARPYLPWSVVAPLSNFEMEERYLTANKTFGVSLSILEERLRGGINIDCLVDCSVKYNADNLYNDYRNLYNSYFDDQGKKIPEEKISELLARYEKLETNWQNVDAGFVYYGPWERNFTRIDFNQDSQLELIYRNDMVHIYKIK